jgi:hypothetical protein
VDLRGALDYGLSGMAAVEGWLSPLDFAVMTSVLMAQGTIPVEGDLAEIGVWRGKSAILLSHFVEEGQTLHAIDVFDLYYPGEVPSGPTKPYADPATFRANLSAFGCPAAVSEIVSDTRHDDMLVAKLATRGVRFFHIDGGHSYEHVEADCSTALAAVTGDTVLSLDDFMQIDNPAVTEAIIDTFRDAPGGLVPFAVTRKKLYLAPREAVDGYWRYLIALVPNAVTRKRPVLNASTLILNPAKFDLARDFGAMELAQNGSGEAIGAWVRDRCDDFPRIDDWLSDTPSIYLNA